MRHDSPALDGAVWAASGIGVVALGYAFWATVVEPRWLERVEIDAAVPALPPAWAGRRLGLLADVQLGMTFDNESTVRRAVEQLRRARPAAVLLAGDFILHTKEDASGRISRACRVLAPLPADGIDCYAVLGNHDYGHAGDRRRTVPLEDQVAGALSAAGIRVLRNESIRLRTPGAGSSDLHVVGIGPRRPGRDDPAAAFAAVPPGAPRVVLLHNPASFRSIAPGAAPLALAGHTHGGQVQLLPFLRVPLWMRVLGSRRDLRYGAGWLDDLGQAGNRLYVSRGIGFSRLPVRLNARPEVTVITLRA